MSQQPKAAATQEQPPVASAGGGRGVQQGQNSSTGASTVKTRYDVFSTRVACAF